MGEYRNAFGFSRVERFVGLLSSVGALLLLARGHYLGAALAFLPTVGLAWIQQGRIRRTRQADLAGLRSRTAMLNPEQRATEAERAEESYGSLAPGIRSLRRELALPRRRVLTDMRRRLSVDGKDTSIDGSQQPVVASRVPFWAVALGLYPAGAGGFFLALALVAGLPEESRIFLVVPAAVVSTAFTGYDAALRGLKSTSHAWWALGSGAFTVALLGLALGLSG